MKSTKFLHSVSGELCLRLYSQSVALSLTRGTAADNVISRENEPLSGSFPAVEERDVWDEGDRSEAAAISGDIRNDADVCTVPSFSLGFYGI